jgi:16S rRNA (uracil1498-N3)-methyltransferase
VLADTGRKSASLDIEQALRAQEAGPDLDYLFAPLKHARLDYMVQKAVEMGAARLRPVLTRRTQAHRVNLERMRANVIEAAEQCGVLALAQIEEPLPLEKVLAQWPQDRLLVFCDEDAPMEDAVAALRARCAPGAPVAVLIGPEGGFDPAERAMLMGMKQTLAISLGPRILRADTAAVAALAVVHAALGG